MSTFPHDAPTDRLLLGAIFILAIVGFYWTESYYGSLLIDSARTATVPWRLLEGQMLYRDVFSEYGPLEPYVVALAYRLGGVNLDSIRLLGLLITLGILTLVYRLCRLYLSPWLATFATVFVLLVYGYGYYVPGTHIFNFIFPYSFSATIGLLLLLLLLLRIRDLLLRPSGILATWIGFIYALCLLTKLEVAFAATIAWGGAHAALLLSKRRHPKLAVLSAGPLAAASTLVAVYTYFAPFVSLIDHLRKRIVPLATGTLHLSPSHPGADVALQSVLTGLGYLPVYLAPPLVAWLGASLHERLGSNHRRAVLAEMVLAAMTLLLLEVALIDNVFPVLWGLSVINVGAVVFYVQRWLKSDRQDMDSSYLAIFALVALGFLARYVLVLNASGYGFYLAVPATIVMFVLMLRVLPDYLHCRNPALATRQVAYGTTLMTIVMLLHLRHTIGVLSLPTGEIRAERGTLHGPVEQANVMQELINDLRYPVSLRGRRVWVIPEGDWISYMLDSPPRSYFSVVFPFYVARPADEQAVIDEFSFRDYDYVVLLQRSYDNYGIPVIGEDFFRAGMTAIRERYDVEAVYGSEPFSGAPFGATLYRAR